MRKEPDAWLSINENTLVVVVYGIRERNGGFGMISIPYEYQLGFTCAGIHDITAPPKNGAGNRKKKPPVGRRPEPLKAPLRQLHMFNAG